MQKINLKTYFTFIILLSFCISAQSEKKVNENPRLVVGIVVDQMKYEYIPKFWNKYGNNGFKRLVSQGFNAKNAHYSYAVTSTAPGHATVVTGTTPNYHGIVGNEWFNPSLNKEIYCVDDFLQKSVGTLSDEGKKSPRNLQTTTISDENRISSNFKAKTFSVALKDRSAVLSGGHTSKMSYWFNAKNEGKFITSSYYMNELPEWVKRFNERKNIKKYITNWETYYDIKLYVESGPDLNQHEIKYLGKNNSTFPYDLERKSKTKSGKIDYDVIKYSPFGNDIVKDFALDAIEHENLGKDEITDFLHIGFSSTDHVGHRFGANSVEVLDMYIRLDKNIEEILDYLDKKIGEKKYIIYLTSDHGITHVPSYLSENKVPFNQLYSMNIFNEELKKYIKDVSNYNVYLNQERIAESVYSYKEIKDLIRNELKKEPWVYDVYDFTQLDEAVSYSEDYAINMIYYNSHPDLRGDLAFFLKPLWYKKSSSASNHGTGRTYDTHVPLIFYGKGIKTGFSSQRIYIRDIAPTLSTILGISFSALSTGNPIISAIK
ncbi:MAG: alkaline phosphatase [Flavobacteriaceae bacterium]|nr:alkaline phosphatase [Flavobacteriaceae bacterium]